MRVIAILISLVWFCSPGLSQDLLELKVKALFEEEKNEVTVDFFHGRLDGMEEIVIAMACDKKDCRGVLRYVRSKEELILKGLMRKEEIYFNEYNNFGKISGQITAKKVDNELTGWWSSNNEDIYFDFELEKVNTAPVEAAPCGQKNWIKHFSSVNSNARMLIQNIEGRGVSGNLYLEKSGPGFQLAGSVTNAGYYELDIYELDKSIGTLVCGFSDQENQKVIFKWNDKKDDQINFNQTENFEFGCVDHGDFIGSYSITYPIANNDDFNACNPRLGPHLRASLQAVAWTEVNFYDGKIISGIINFLNNWSRENKTVAFIFDLERGVLYDQGNLVVQGEELAKLILKEKEILKKKYNHNKSFCTWVDNQAFDLINIRHNGISFESSFHSVFGKEKIVVPFDSLTPYLLTSEALTLLKE